MQIAAMIFTGALTVLLPLGLMAFYHRRGGSWAAFFTGAGTFFVFAMVLEQLLHALVLASPLGGIIQGNIWLYGLYGGLAAGIFEETGRLLAFRFLLKKHTAPATALAYGAGHGGIEAVLTVGLTMLSNLLLLAMLKSGTVTDPAVREAAEAVAAVPAGMFLWAALERLAAVAIHVCCSVLVFTAVRQAGKRWLFPVAVGAHAALDFLAVTVNALAGTAPAELATAAFAALTVCFTAWVYRNLKNMPKPLDLPPGGSGTIKERGGVSGEDQRGGGPGGGHQKEHPLL